MRELMDRLDPKAGEGGCGPFVEETMIGIPTDTKCSSGKRYSSSPQRSRLFKRTVNSWELTPDGSVQGRFLELVQTKELPEGLGLRHTRILDHLMSGKDPEEDDAAFQKLLSARNSSILAHGVDPIGRKTAEKFLQYLDTLVTVPEELRSGARHAELLAL